MSMLQRVLLAEIIYEANPDIQPWDGDPFTFTTALNRNMFHANLAVKQADAILAQFRLDS